MNEQNYALAVVEPSGRHIHLSEKDAKVLFGEDFQLTAKEMLGEAGVFLSDAKLLIEGENGKSVRTSVLGPYRKETQVELSYTEARTIGMKPPLGNSGELEGTAAITLVGPKGQLRLERGAMVARRHVHMDPKDAERLGIQDREMVLLQIEGPRALIFEQVVARIAPPEVHSTYSNAHLDYDEWNAAGLTGKTAKGRIYKTPENWPPL